MEDATFICLFESSSVEEGDRTHRVDSTSGGWDPCQAARGGPVGSISNLPRVPSKCYEVDGIAQQSP